jgi:hypothetical protein
MQFRPSIKVKDWQFKSARAAIMSGRDRQTCVSENRRSRACFRRHRRFTLNATADFRERQHPRTDFLAAL